MPESGAWLPNTNGAIGVLEMTMAYDGARLLLLEPVLFVVILVALLAGISVAGASATAQPEPEPLPAPLSFVSNLDLECFRTRPYQPPVSYLSPLSATVGSSGKSSERFAVLTASARSVPALM